MKRIFLSLPMSGRNDEEIEKQYYEMVEKFIDAKLFDDEDIIFDWNFNYTPEKNASPVITEPLLYLGEAIQKMAYCDGVYFGKGWSKARGCLIEMEVCVKYDIPYFINRNDGVICRVIDNFKEET